MSQPQTINDVVEARRRSRSNTPLVTLRVSSDRENGSEPSPSRKVRQMPTISLIDEEEELPSPAQKTQPAGQTRASAVRKTRVVTSDYSSDDVSPDRVRKAAAAVVANVANAQLARMAEQLSSSQSSRGGTTTMTTTTTTSSETTKVVVAGGKQEEKKVVTVKNSNSRTGSASDGKEMALGKVATATSPKKGTGSPQKPSLPVDETQKQEAVMAGSKRTTTTTTTASKASATDTFGGVIRTSTPRSTSKLSMPSTKVILTPEELQHHAAYKEYLEAGEYWNKYPKTDYTYSELSPHRREVAPGLVAMPNMSRPSLAKHAERVHTMIQRNPGNETYIRERYTSVRTAGLFATSDPYDSTDEVANSLARSSQRHQRQTMVDQRTIVSRFFLSIVTFCFTCVDTVRSVFRRRDEQRLYYTRIEDERGFFTRVYGFLSSFFISVFKRIYLLISSVLFLDAWLLHTAAENVEQQHAGQRKRRFLLFLLVLLPLLLVGAFLLADDGEQIVLPASSRATLALSSLSNVLPSNVREISANVESFYRYMGSVNLNFTSSIPALPSVWSMVPSFGWLTALSWPWRWPLNGGGTKESSVTYETIRTTLQRTLSREEYDELVRHIDAHIDGLMEQKYASRLREVGREHDRMQASQQATLAPEITLHVADIIEKSLVSYNYQLTDADVDKVAQTVRLNLEANFPHLFEQKPQENGPSGGSVVGLTQENLSEIYRIVEQQITVHHNDFVITGTQLEELLTRILSSERFLTLVDERVAATGARMALEFQSRASITEQQQREALVDDLRKELTDIKVHFSEQLLTSSVQWEERLQTLKDNHGQLEDQLRAYRLEHNELYRKLLVDIDARLDGVRKERYDGVNKVVRENIITILGLNVKQDVADGDLRAWISGLFVARDHLEQRLAEIQMKADADLRKEIDQTASRLMKEIGDTIREEMLVRLEEVRAEAFAGRTVVTERQSSGDDRMVNSKSTLTEDDVRRIVRDALTIYDADKTGMVDYALESAGGQVLSTRCTESYQANSAELRIFGIIPIWYSSNTPRTVISPTMEPGLCWAFQGFPGYLVIQLNTEIIVTGFTLEHLSKLLVSNGSISSAPKHFTVWGLTALNDPEPILLGSYEYLDRLGSSVQYFAVQNKDWRQPLQIVELRIESNHGNGHYTCLYRFRVHGDKV